METEQLNTDLARHVEETPLVDTHEHLRREADWLDDGPDILQDLFDNYVRADLHTAGASAEAMRRLMDASAPDIAARFRGIEAAWRATQFTGYGEAVRLIARQIYGLDELSADGLAAAAGRTAELRRPGERYRLLHDVANLDQVQTDDMRWPCPPDDSGPEFFLYDLSWFNFCTGDVDVPAVAAETGIEVSGLASLRRAMEAIFARHAPCAIAVKAQHAYARTLAWSERSDADAEAALQRVLGPAPERSTTPPNCASATGAGRAASSWRSRTICRSRSTPATTPATTACRPPTFPPATCARCSPATPKRALC